MRMVPSIFGERFLDDWFGGFPFVDDRALRRVEHSFWNPQGGSGELMKTDIKESDDGFEMAIDLPGFSKENVQAELVDGYLTISASREYDSADQEKGGEAQTDKASGSEQTCAADGSAKDTGRYIRRERYSGSCMRRFYVGDELKQEDVKAQFKDGTLKLFIPKKEKAPEVPASKYIAIEG